MQEQETKEYSNHLNLLDLPETQSVDIASVMSIDASPAASSPMTNGTAHDGSHREVDASTPLTNNTPASEANSALQDVCADLYARVHRFLQDSPRDALTQRAQQQTKISIQVIEQALQKYDFDAGELSLSYNGGKDCLVLLILYLAVLHTHFSPSTTSNAPPAKHTTSYHFPTSIPSIYAKPPDPFPAVTTFVESSSRDYHLDLTHISTNPGTNSDPRKILSHSSPPSTPGDETALTNNTSAQRPQQDGPQKIVTFRTAFANYLDSHPSVRAIFVGTRRTDPHGAHLTHFDMTDGNWPRFMRIHPVIDWHLDEIWCFLRADELADPRTGRKLDYCTMYDEGYTSLGGVGDTLRNPRLKFVDEKGVDRFRPAYALTDDGEERLGRE